MEITKDIREGQATLTLAGRFDATWSDGVAGVLAECVRAGAHVVRLDLDGIVFLSSAGIRVLLASYRELSRLGGNLAVTRASDAVFTVLQTSGLAMLLKVEAVSAAQPGVEAPDRRFDHGGARIEQWTLSRDARLRMRSIGDPALVLEGRGAAVAPTRVAFPTSAFGLGVAAFGRDAGDCAGRYGEFLAVGGTAICHANVGHALPDWVIAEGQMVPEAEMLWGLVAEGGFASELRFEAAESATGELAMSQVLELALDAAGGAPVALAMVAETAQLVGAALRSMDAGTAATTPMFEFPGVRDRLLFTSEPAWTSVVALVVGVACRQAPASLAPLLRPAVADASIVAHLHAAAFPYRPLRKGRVDLGATLAHLFEDQSVRALLHLVNDWRQPSGAGQSGFTRGAVWTAPLEPA
jgi:anti-anti-sigma factor